MPTPEASASSSMALRNANTTELVIEETVTDSFKANVSTMTQDQCLDIGHQQANSNNRSSSDKVSDDLNNSKNSVVSNGVNSVQEFNVDVNREYSTDLVIVQNRTVDADSPPTGEVLPTSKQLTPSDCVDSKDLSDNSINNIDANKSDCTENNIVADMTVITHQNSSENIRDIIANSDKANKNSSDSQLDSEDKSARGDLNSRSANRSTGTRRVRKLTRSQNVNESEDDHVEDPIERLNKLRASISSALSEVKGVLKQYSTDQSCDDQNESAPSKQTVDDGPVRFRFVRKIRRRSVFSEDDETEIPKTVSEVATVPIIENQAIEEVPSESQDNQKNVPNQDPMDESKNEIAVSSNIEAPSETIKNDTDETDKKLIQKAAPESENTANEHQKTTKEGPKTSKVESPSSTSETPKTKNGKTKKVLKKDRRASIAAVEINQISKDPPVIPVELKAQRRPSDSGTLVKQATRIKAKTTDKPKVVTNRKTKSSPSSKAESSTAELSQSVMGEEKADTPVSPTEVKASALIVDSTITSDTQSLIKQEIPEIPTSTVEAASPVQSTESATPSKTVENTSVQAKDDSPSSSPTTTDTSALEESKLAELSSPKVSSAPVVNSTVNTDVSKTATSLNEVNASAPTTQSISGTTESSTVNTNLTPTEVHAPEVVPVPAASTKVKDDSVEKAVAIVKPTANNAPNHSQQTPKPSPKATVVATPNQKTTKPKQLAQDSKPSTPNAPATAKTDSSKSIVNKTQISEVKTVKPIPVESNKQTQITTEAKQVGVSKAATLKESKTPQAPGKTEANKKINESQPMVAPTVSTSETTKQSSGPSTQKDKVTADTLETQADETSSAEPDVPIPSNVPKDAVAVKLNLPGQESVEELQRLEGEQDKEASPPQTPESAAAAPPKKKRKAKRKVVIRRIKRKLSKDDTFLHQKETPAELEICEKEIEEKDLDEEPEEEASDVPKQPKSCLKNRQFEIGDVVMYAEHYKKTQVRWKKAVVTERITSISYKLNIEGEERPAHISYIKKFTDRKVNFGGKEYLEIDYAQIEENEEKERNYSIWNLV